MKLYGLIGYPLGHSFSKQYFTDKFQREGLADCFFEAFPIPHINEFAALVKAHPRLLGMGVTIPYKQQVLPFMTELSDEVKYIGATNSIKVRGDRLIAYNTDITGFEQSFAPLLKPSHQKALVLGTGGAAKAVQYVLRKLGIDYLTVTRQPVEKEGFIQYGQIDQAVMDEYPVIVNCSPAGMHPNEHTGPEIPYQYLGANHYLYDLVYKPAETLFLQKGKAAGATTQNGYDMLVIQAEASWIIWNSD